jgi:hypothetical protein
MQLNNFIERVLQPLDRMKRLVSAKNRVLDSPQHTIELPSRAGRISR